MNSKTVQKLETRKWDLITIDQFRINLLNIKDSKFEKRLIRLEKRIKGKMK